jgi:peroxiredoxin Q/BCP
VAQIRLASASHLVPVLYGRTFLGTTRTTFIIGPDGVVKHVIPRVTPRTHDDEVLAVLEQLAAA